MARRLTDTYFAECSFSILSKTNSQRLSSKKCLGIWVIPENEEILEYIKIAIERRVNTEFGDDYKIVDFLITEITPL